MLRRTQCTVAGPGSQVRHGAMNVQPPRTFILGLDNTSISFLSRDNKCTLTATIIVSVSPVAYRSTCYALSCMDPLTPSEIALLGRDGNFMYFSVLIDVLANFICWGESQFRSPSLSTGAHPCGTGVNATVFSYAMHSLRFVARYYDIIHWLKTRL